MADVKVRAMLEPKTHDLTGGPVDMKVNSLRRDGTRAPIVFLHRFGSTKEDYADVTRHAAFDDRGVLAYDAPGCGRRVCSDVEQVSIPFLVETALTLLESEGIDRFHLVGHSMGGLTALMLADGHPDRILSFCDIEGNIAPEDCFLSRQIHDYADDDPAAFLDAFADRARQAPSGRLLVHILSRYCRSRSPGAFRQAAGAYLEQILQIALARRLPGQARSSRQPCTIRSVSGRFVAYSPRWWTCPIMAT